MRKFLPVAMLSAGVLIGYAMRPAPAVAQAEFQPFTIGQTVRLTVEALPTGSMTLCRVTAVNNDFIQCGGDGQRRPRAVNLRYVQEITPAPER